MNPFIRKKKILCPYEFSTSLAKYWTTIWCKWRKFFGLFWIPRQTMTRTVNYFKVDYGWIIWMAFWHICIWAIQWVQTANVLERNNSCNCFGDNNWKQIRTPHSPDRFLSHPTPLEQLLSSSLIYNRYYSWRSNFKRLKFIVVLEHLISRLSQF